ncbi:MAG: multiprotein bridging factor aMBF1 [Ignisphaera sp.]|uniref:TIGR00270 family protein n=1 Tax=Ignisphaera aggregans TaxID=334771 RepID=A0A7J3MZS5_9CREN
MCGNPIDRGTEKRVAIDNVLLTVCSSCYTKLSPRASKQVVTRTDPVVDKSSKQVIQRPLVSNTTTISSPAKAKESKPKAGRKPVLSEQWELVEDYSEKIKKARESFGWDTRTLALKVKVSENIIKRIESGKLRPTLDLARKLEEVLNIKLLVPAVEDDLSNEKIDKYVTLGEIVDIRSDKR